MPYIDAELKLDLGEALDRILNRIDEATSVGELNYILTSIVKEYVSVGESYARYNAAIGALEAAKLEFYRRAVAAYEDTKIRENGDIY